MSEVSTTTASSAESANISDSTPNSNVTSPSTNNSGEDVSTDVSNDTKSTLGSKPNESASVLIDEPSKYGHLPYAEASLESLTVVSSYGLQENQRFEKLHPAAAEAFMQMANTARDEGVWIVLLSGFRKYDEQAELFYYQTQKRGTPEEAAKSSAPAGYSEHHTGFAMDLGDGHVPSADINQGFANTEAFIWLLQHGSEFGFQLSFPEGNSQGVSYEPWHWRFVGNSEAQSIFNRAQSVN